MNNKGYLEIIFIVFIIVMIVIFNICVFVYNFGNIKNIKYHGVVIDKFATHTGVDYYYFIVYNSTFGQQRFCVEIDEYFNYNIGDYYPRNVTKNNCGCE